ncbi:hypothetical protein BIT28_16445 [Photobacterium proteolyticum]|uniref:Uncharacterized protein n=1 Tax=Photobacterium proteolyticum TaxID=1903952 RepID=A0A1Q9G7P1_9GAMM|nr:hypothetical protein [Photobacterium proteolyticum]OLQ70314.1 hypothetical protein BIT28_16445 [Photobacterium proteolyticum]
MSLWDDLSKFGSGMLDSVGEGFDSLVTTATTPTQSVNPNTQQQETQQADNHGNKVTPHTDEPKQDKTLLYIGGGVAVLLVLGLLILAVKK